MTQIQPGLTYALSLLKDMMFLKTNITQPFTTDMAFYKQHKLSQANDGKQIKLK